ncbi:MAG: adenylate/guanylate cyclase domain-containing protein [Chloroflexota bacterium]
MICPSCGSENRAGAKFCNDCAAPFAAACPQCGFANPPTARFCSECATPLAVAATPDASTTTGRGPRPVSERRLVSVLFADLVGFTPFSEERDAEEVRETLSRYFDVSREIIERYGGTVEKFIGDAVMAVWGAPIAREDDAERAVRAALDLVDIVTTLGPGIRARCGVLTGEAAVTLGATNQGMVAGDIVNTASRLQSAARPGTVLVGETTQRAAAQSIVFEDAGEQALKGKAEAVPTWRAVRVVSEIGGRNRSEALEAPFVGRDEELRQIKDLFHATQREGRPRLVSLIGPGGIGKSRLAWEFLKYVDGVAGQTWWHAGRSPAYGDGITFWALGEMIRGRAGLLETDDEAVSREKIAAAVEQHVPAADERRWIQSALLALLGFEADISSDQLFAAWRTFFERMAAVSPVVMLFEDLHHADSGTLDFIDHLMEWSRTVPITVITLARPELLEKRPDWGAGKRNFTSIHLEPLPPEEMHRLLAGLVPGLPPRTADAIVERADGMPLYAVETVRMLLAQGQLVLEDGAYRPTGDLGEIAVPQSLTSLIAARLDGLEAADRGLIEDAAVLGQSFTVAGLSAISGINGAELEPRLRTFVRRELLILEADARSPERGQYSFMQSLIREVAYNTLAKKDRKVRHLAAARFFESLGTDELAGGLAGHYLAAQRLAADKDEADALAAQARIALRGAADRAASLGSHEQAVKFLEQALEVATSAEDRADLHGRGQDSAEHGLDPSTVERHALGQLEAAREIGDRPAIAAAIANYARTVQGWLGTPQRAVEILEPAWAEFSDLEQTPEGVWLMAALAASNSGSLNEDVALGWVDRYLPIAERLDLMEAIATGLISRAQILIKMNRSREALVLLRGGHQLATAIGFWERERTGRVLLTFYAQWNDSSEGLALAREGLEIAHRISSRSYGATMVGNGSICAIRVGEWDWVEALLDEWIPPDPSFAWYAEFFSDRAILTALRGGDASADIAKAAQLRQAITDSQFESYEHWARSWAAFTAGSYADACHEAELAAAVTSYFHPLATPLAARAALWAGDAERAAAAVEALHASGHRGTAVELDMATIRAGVAALEGRGAEALAGYRELLKGWRQAGLAFDEALAVTDMATLLPPNERASADVHTAVDWARATLEGLGAKPILDRLAIVRGAASPAPQSRPIESAPTEAQAESVT